MGSERESGRAKSFPAEGKAWVEGTRESVEGRQGKRNEMSAVL